jgi:hypothetical protein
LLLAWKCLKSVCGGGWWWLESKYSDRLWLSFSLALAKPNRSKLTTSPGGRMKLSNKNAELLGHPSDIEKHIRPAELSFSPQSKRKAGGGGHLEELNSPSKRLRFRKILHSEKMVDKAIWRNLLADYQTVWS